MENSKQSRFWDKYIEKNNVLQYNARYCALLCPASENYNKAQQNPCLFEHTALKMDAYLREKGRNSRLQD